MKSGKVVKLIILALIAVPYAIACICSPFASVYMKPGEVYNYSHVITGTCIATEAGVPDYKHTFIRNEVYRGFLSLDTFEVYTTPTCGIWPKKGEKWLISAHLTGNKLRTSQCDRSYNAATFPGAGCVEMLDSMLEANPLRE